MEIAFAVDKLTFRSGIVRVVFNIAKELQKNNSYKITIICTSDNNEKKKWQETGIRLISLSIDKKRKINKYLSYSKSLKNVFKSYHPDVIIVSGTEHVLFYSIGISKLKSHNNLKMIVWEHRNFSAGPKFRLEWIGKRYALRKWNDILCITKKDYNQYVKFKENNLEIKNGASINQIYNLTNFSVKKNVYNLKSKKIISCGYLSWIKGFDILIKVATIVFNKHPDWAWDIYGEGEKRNDLERLIRENNLEKYVFLRGYTNNINNKYKEYSFFVLTSRTEGMGMVIIEAQKSGLPVISFDIKCGPSDVISDGVNGYLIKPFDKNVMAEKICNLIENEKIRIDFSNKSQINLNEFDKHYIINKWIAMLEK